MRFSIIWSLQIHIKWLSQRNSTGQTEVTEECYFSFCCPVVSSSQQIRSMVLTCTSVMEKPSLPSTCKDTCLRLRPHGYQHACSSRQASRKLILWLSGPRHDDFKVGLIARVKIVYSMLCIMIIFKSFPFISLPVSLGKTSGHISVFIGHNTDTVTSWKKNYFPFYSLKNHKSLQ